MPKSEINTFWVPLYKRFDPFMIRTSVESWEESLDWWWKHLTFGELPSSLCEFMYWILWALHNSPECCSFCLFVCLEQQDCGYRGIEIWSWNTDVLKWDLGNSNLYSFLCVYRICNIYTSQNDLIKITFSLLKIIPRNLQILQSTWYFSSQPPESWLFSKITQTNILYSKTWRYLLD